MDRNVVRKQVVAVLLRSNVGPQIKFDGQRIIHPAVSQILPIVTDGGRIPPIDMDHKGEAISAVDGARSMKTIRRQGRINVLGAGSGVVRHLEGEGGFESHQHRQALLVPDGPHLTRVGVGQPQSGGTASIDARREVVAVAESCLAVDNPGAGLVVDIGFDGGSSLDPSHLPAFQKEGGGEVDISHS